MSAVPDRGQSKIYAGAAAIVVFAAVLLVTGRWEAALVGLGLAAWIASHPYFRREWYRVGYSDGLLDGSKIVVGGVPSGSAGTSTEPDEIAPPATEPPDV